MATAALSFAIYVADAACQLPPCRQPCSQLSDGPSKPEASSYRFHGPPERIRQHAAAVGHGSGNGSIHGLAKPFSSLIAPAQAMKVGEELCSSADLGFSACGASASENANARRDSLAAGFLAPPRQSTENRFVQSIAASCDQPHPHRAALYTQAIAVELVS